MRYFCALFLTLLAGCGGDAGGGAAAPAGEDRPLEADFEEVYRIGGIAAEGWDAFTEIADLGFDARGHLYIRDGSGSSTRVLMVDEFGGLAAEIGRSGDGPEEIREAGHMVARPEGGVVIVDDGHRAFLVFAADGSFERALRFPDAGVAAVSYALAVRAAREGNTLFLTRSPSARVSERQVSVATGDRTIYRVPLDEGEGEEAATIPFAEAWETRPPREVEVAPTDPSDMFGALESMLAYFEPGLVFDVFPGGAVAFSDSSAYTIKIQALAGGAPRVVGRPIHPEPVTDDLQERVRTQALADFESSLARQLEGAGMPDVPEANREAVAAMMSSVLDGLRGVIENARFMPEVPVVRDLRTTWDGMIWVERWERDPLAQINDAFGGAAPTEEVNAEGWIDVLHPEAGYMGTFPRAKMPMPRAFGPGGLVAFVETDEFDVPTIVVRRLPPTIRLETGSSATGGPGGGG